MITRIVCTAGWLTLWLPAQSVIATRAGLVSYAEGDIYMDGHRARISPAHPSTVNRNAVVRTGAGRAEVMLGPCAVMWVGAHAAFRIVDNALSDTRVELLSGSTMIDAGEIARGNKVTLSIGAAAAVVDRRGVFRFDAAPARVKVLAGRTTVHWASRAWAVRAGSLLPLDNPASVRNFEKDTPDSLDLWSKVRAAAWEKADRAASRRARNDQEEDTAAAAAASVADAATRAKTFDPRAANAQMAPPPMPGLARGACTLAGW